MTKSIIRQIIDLENKEIPELRKLYNEIMPKQCAANAGREYLRPRIAYRLQELVFGGMSEECKEKLYKIAGGKTSSDSLKTAQDLIVGTKICREWNGAMHEVEVLKDCYGYQGQKFKSLSSIAKKITGTKWNGPKFFKLRNE
jgi:hypothetical protein